MKKLENSYCTQIQSKGKTVYDAPIRIVNKHDLKNYGITWKDCVRLHIGVNETINVYMYKTKDPKLADFSGVNSTLNVAGTTTAFVALFLVSRKFSLNALNATSVQTCLFAKIQKSVRPMA